MRTLYAPSEPKWSTLVCPSCGEHANAEELVLTEWHGSMCEPCAVDLGLSACDFCGDWLRSFQLIQLHDETSCINCYYQSDEYKQTEREI